MKSRAYHVMLTLGLTVALVMLIGNPSHSRKKGTGTIKVEGKTIKIDYMKHKKADPKVKCKNCHTKHKCKKYHRKGCNNCHGVKKKVKQHDLEHEVAPSMKKVVKKVCLGCHVKRKKAGAKKPGPQTLDKLYKK